MSYGFKILKMLFWLSELLFGSLSVPWAARIKWGEPWQIPWQARVSEVGDKQRQADRA